MLSQYANAREFLWVQEEPLNAGAWSFVEPHLHPFVAPRGLNVRVLQPCGCATPSPVLRAQIRYVGRPAFAAPSSGVGSMNKAEVAALASATFPSATSKSEE